jgi:DNA-nicking Smr family endonuclease
MKRRLTPEELELWQYVTRNDAPLHPHAVPEREAYPELPSAPIPAQASFPAVRAYRKGMHTEAAAPAKTQPVSTMDRATAERLRKGEYAIDARLDLHGLTQDTAHARLASFILGQHQKKARCLLVITGKGAAKYPPGDVRGILQSMVPRWLAEAPFAPLVLGIIPAAAKHGGSGAYYVMLRRQRGS